MTDKEINEAIAAYCGWFHGDGRHGKPANPPDFVRSHAALARAEKLMTTAHRLNLMSLIAVSGLTGGLPPSRVRAEFFLRAVGVLTGDNDNDKP